MRKTRTDEAAPVTIKMPAPMLTTEARLAAIEERLTLIERTREVQALKFAEESSRAEAQTRKARESEFRAAAPKRAAHLPAYIAERLVVHPTLRTSCAAVAQDYDDWSTERKLPALECYDIYGARMVSGGASPELEFVEALAAALDRTVETVETTNKRGVKSTQLGFAGIGILPAGKTAAGVVAELDQAAHVAVGEAQIRNDQHECDRAQHESLVRHLEEKRDAQRFAAEQMRTLDKQRSAEPARK